MNTSLKSAALVLLGVFIAIGLVYTFRSTTPEATPPRT